MVLRRSAGDGTGFSHSDAKAVAIMSWGACVLREAWLGRWVFIHSGEALGVLFPGAEILVLAC
jgi:hypothetical protein